MKPHGYISAKVKLCDKFSLPVYMYYNAGHMFVQYSVPILINCYIHVTLSLHSSYYKYEETS